MTRPSLGGILAGAVAIALALGCAVRGPRSDARGPLRISDVAEKGDGSRRASTRLILAGLESDVSGDAGHALSQYERAIQIDPTNPFAYLAIARHYAEVSQPERALAYLDQSELLFESQGVSSPRVEAHLAGLRGAALWAAGQFAAAAPLFDRARELAPTVWSDAYLSPEELR